MAATHCETSTVRPERRGSRRLLRWWYVASLIWLAVVAFGFCARVHEQVDATRQIGRELQMLDCEAAGNAKCETRSLADYEGSWSDTAILFASFGFWILFTWAVVPPCSILALVGAVAWFGKRASPPAPRA
jgi:hypothetical protein